MSKGLKKFINPVLAVSETLVGLVLCELFVDVIEDIVFDQGHKHDPIGPCSQEIFEDVVFNSANKESNNGSQDESTEE